MSLTGNGDLVLQTLIELTSLQRLKDVLAWLDLREEQFELAPLIRILSRFLITSSFVCILYILKLILITGH